MASKFFVLNLNKTEAIIVSPKNGISLTTNDNTVKDFGVIFDQHVSFNASQCDTFVFLSGIFSPLVKSEGKDFKFQTLSLTYKVLNNQAPSPQ